jgi:hypothetical protein
MVQNGPELRRARLNRLRPTPGCYKSHELVCTERLRADHQSVLALLHNLRRTGHVIVMPVRQHHRTNRSCGIDTECSQVSKRRGNPCFAVSAAINDDPVPKTKVQDDALADPGTEDGDLKLVARGRY